jgi:hypothetical protein
MKYFFLALLIPLASYAQEINGTQMSQVFNVEGVSASELHSRINTAIANIFNSANDVIQLNDPQNKKFIIKGVASVPVENTYKAMYPKNPYLPSIYNYDHPMTLNIASRDGRYKLTLKYGRATYMTNGTIQETTVDPLMDFTEEYVNSQVEAQKQMFNRPEYKIVGKKKKQSMLDAIPKSFYAYRDGLIDYGTLLFLRINDEVNSASEEDDW